MTTVQLVVIYRITKNFAWRSARNRLIYKFEISLSFAPISCVRRQSDETLSFYAALICEAGDKKQGVAVE